MSAKITLDDSGTLERVNKVLAGIEGGSTQAIKSALQRTAQHIRSGASKAIREKYDLAPAAIRENENARLSYEISSGAITASVYFSGRKIPLYRYGRSAPKQPTVDKSVTTHALINGYWRTVHPSVPASGHQLLATAPATFSDAFVARMKSGHVGIFERTGASTANGADQIHELMGSSVPQMLGSPDVEEQITKDAAEKFYSRLEQEMYRILNGFGR